MTDELLFVYGSLRRGFDGPMAAWLASTACHKGRATARGTLYRIDYYPGFVPGEEGQVVGDLFLLPDAAALLAELDEHEECAAHFSQPHEYRREQLIVESGGASLRAWTYVYALDVSTLKRIESGDFLA